MEISRFTGITINAPQFFANPAFVAWLNSDAHAMTWHVKGQDPSEWSDVVVFVEPSFNGEGSDSDMPEDIWNTIVETCREHLVAGAEQLVAVRLTNLDDGESS